MEVSADEQGARCSMSNTSEEADIERYRQVATILHDVAKPMRVLSALAWPAETRERFLASGGRTMPDHQIICLTT